MTKISKNYSPNFNIPKRTKNKIKFIILHYTGMKKESSALKRLCDEKSKVSAHYFIKKNGDLINLVPDLYEAWHAGRSSWKKIKFLNKYSIGIEIQNQGHDLKYEKFSSKQIITVKKLLKKLIKKYKINLNDILGHSDIAPERKKDPGEKFPWQKLYNNRIGIWHNLNKNMLFKLRKKKITSKKIKLFHANLKKFGYSAKSLSKVNKYKYKILLIKAFQRRFRPELINGIIDQECLIISNKINTFIL